MAFQWSMVPSLGLGTSSAFSAANTSDFLHSYIAGDVSAVVIFSASKDKEEYGLTLSPGFLAGQDSVAVGVGASDGQWLVSLRNTTPLWACPKLGEAKFR